MPSDGWRCQWPRAVAACSGRVQWPWGMSWLRVVKIRMSCLLAVFLLNLASAFHRRASTGREVFIAPLAAHGKLQVPSCHPYEVRARGSEISRHMRGGHLLGYPEEAAVFSLRS